MTQNMPTTKRRRNLIWGAVIAVVVMLALGAAAFVFVNQAKAIPEPQETSEPSPVTTQSSTPSSTPTPSVTPEPAPTDGAVALPDDCLEIYTPEFLDTFGAMDLNHPGVDGSVSRFEPVETIRETLPGIKCQWGGPTEGGIHTAVNSITPDEEIGLIAAATESGFTCAAGGENATLCRYSESFEEDPSSPVPDPVTWTISEEVYVRDGLVVTTWWAGTQLSIDSATQPVYDTLWPQG